MRGLRSSTKGPNVRHTRFFYAVIVVWLLGLIVIAAAHANQRFGSGVQFVVTAIILAITSFVTLIWFAIWGPCSLRLRAAVISTLLVTALVLAAVFRLEEVTGGMRPRFVFRWTGTADEQLEQLSDHKSSEPSGIDLATSTPDDYPNFLGPDYNQSIERATFATDWSESPPTCLWRQPIGAGWSSFAAVNGFAVTQEQRGEQEVVTCYEVTSGRLLWASPIQTRHETKLGGPGPRSTPSIADGRVYSVGATGILRCLDGATGRELWRHNLLAEVSIQDDSQGVAWGRAGSPLIADQYVIVPVGGPANGQKNSLIAYDRLSGDEVWRSGTHQISYASPVRAKLLDHDQIVVVLENFVAGFDTHSGELLWEHPWPGESTTNANVSNAVPIGDRRVFLSKGYGGGAELIELERRPNRGWNVTSVWKRPVVMKTKLSNVVVYDNHVYGLDDVLLECIELETGAKRWKRGRFGYGQLLRVGETLLVLSEQGELAAVKATPTRFIELGRFQALDGKCWNHLCIFGPYLLLRNATEAACYELPGWSGKTPSSGDLPRI